VLAGVGAHTISYSYTDANGCTGTTSKVLLVNTSPKPEILNTDLTFCENDPKVLIAVSPSGGMLSGTGISGMYFDPVLAGIGSQTISYSLTDANGCSGKTSKEFSVIALPKPEILNTDLTFCENEPKVLITVSPSGGVLSGTGISGMYFDPVLAGVGSHTIGYFYTDTNGCSGKTSKVLSVNALPKPEILNTDLTFCENDPKVLITVSPLGGVLSGTGISGMYFDPVLAGVGAHTIGYSYTDAIGCTGKTSKESSVNALPKPEILNTDLTFCENDPKVLIAVSPSGGVLSGTGISGLYFDPVLAGAGAHLISYALINQNECSATIEKQFVIYEKTFIDLGPDLILDIEETINLKPNSNGNSFVWYDGSVDSQKEIISRDLGVGEFNIWAIAANNDHCFCRDSMLLTVDNLNTINSENDFTGAYVYPNPIGEGFYVKLNENERIESVFLYGKTGQMILNHTPSAFPYFNISHLTPGAYLLKINTNRQAYIFKLIKS
jgi:hypothetical protein